MQRKTALWEGAVSNQTFNFAVNDFDAKASARCKQVFVVTDLVVSEIQCTYLLVAICLYVAAKTK